MVLITGGVKCGKSALAESILEGAAKKVYLATMVPYGEEACAAIARHRSLRAGKGFETLEVYTDLMRAQVKDCSVLLECLGNLCANELFREHPKTPEETAAYILEGIDYLRQQARSLVLVTCQVGADGLSYEAGTMDYIRVLGEVNRGAAQMADTVAECVFGIPVLLKGTL